MTNSSGKRKAALGKCGEQMAADYLTSKGYCVLAHNVRTPYGEIDLIAEDSGQLVFVEVKTRSSTSFGNPEEAISHSKMTHMIESAECYLQENPEIDQDWRIDVIAIVQRANQALEIVHFKNTV